jgi:hypothetical protein
MKTLFTLFVLVASTIQSAFACPIVVYSTPVHVYNKETLQGIPDMEITVWRDGKLDSRTKTDSTGKAQLVLYSGEYLIKFSSIHYASTSYKVSIERNKRKSIDAYFSNKSKTQIKEHVREVVYARNTPIKNTNVIPELDLSLDPDYHALGHCKMTHQARAAAKQQHGATNVFNELLVYPNPLRGTYLNIESKYDGNKLLLIYDLSGKEVLRSKIVLHQQLDVSKLEKGIYFLKVIDEANNEVSTQKVVIQ